MPATSEHQQLELPFALLDVRGRVTLSVPEVAQRLGCSTRHVCALITSGDLCALSIGKGKRRMSARVPVEAFTTFVVTAMTCPWNHSALRTLPLQALINHHKVVGEYLRSKGVRG
jgi:excisionase family DNA binding protein